MNRIVKFLLAAAIFGVVLALVLIGLAPEVARGIFPGGLSMKRTEPSAYLAPNKGQPKLDYVPAAACDIRKRFEAIRLAADEERRLAASKSAASSTRLAVIGRKA